MRQYLWIAAGAVLLCFQAFKNKYPILLPETGGFIFAGFGAYEGPNTFVPYGMFVAHASWGISLWMVVGVQALMLSALVYLYFRQYAGSGRWQQGYLVYLACLSLFSGAGWSVCAVAAGIMPALSVLCAGLMLLRNGLPGWGRIAAAGAGLLAGVIGWGSLKAGNTVPDATFGLNAWIAQAGNIMVKDWVVPGTGSATFQSLYAFFPLETREYMLTRQFQHWMQLRYSAISSACLTTIGIIGTCVLLWQPFPSLRKLAWMLISVTLLLITVEAWANLGRVRPDAQYAWLLTLPAALWLTRKMQYIYENR